MTLILSLKKLEGKLVGYFKLYSHCYDLLDVVKCKYDIIYYCV